MTARRRMILVWGQYALLLAGFSALGYCAIVVAEATRYQVLAREQMRKANVALAQPSTARSSLAVSQPGPLLLAGGIAMVGRIDVPRAHVSVMVAEGTSPRTLRIAAGHIPGTALPGKPGNVAIAAHRLSFGVWVTSSPAISSELRFLEGSTSTVSGSPMSSVPTRRGFWSLPRISC